MQHLAVLLVGAERREGGVAGPRCGLALGVQEVPGGDSQIACMQQAGRHAAEAA